MDWTKFPFGREILEHTISFIVYLIKIILWKVFTNRIYVYQNWQDQSMNLTDKRALYKIGIAFLPLTLHIPFFLPPPLSRLWPLMMLCGFQPISAVMFTYWLRIWSQEIGLIDFDLHFEVAVDYNRLDCHCISGAGAEKLLKFKKWFWSIVEKMSNSERQDMVCSGLWCI
jgi:hypothetical protein